MKLLGVTSFPVIFFPSPYGLFFSGPEQVLVNDVMPIFHCTNNIFQLIIDLRIHHNDETDGYLQNVFVLADFLHLYLPYEKGGLKLQDTQTKAASFRVKWLVEAFQEEKSVERFLIDTLIGKHGTINGLKLIYTLFGCLTRFIRNFTPLMRDQDGGCVDTFLFQLMSDILMRC